MELRVNSDGSISVPDLDTAIRLSQMMKERGQTSPEKPKAVREPQKAVDAPPPDPKRMSSRAKARAILKAIVQSGAAGISSNELMPLVGTSDPKGIAPYTRMIKDMIRGVSAEPIEDFIWVNKAPGGETKWFVNAESLRTVGVIK